MYLLIRKATQTLPMTITAQCKQNKGKPFDEKGMQDFRSVIG